MTTDGLHPAAASVPDRPPGGRRRRLAIGGAVAVLAIVVPWTVRHTGDRASAAEAATPAAAARTVRSAEGLEVQFLAALNTRRRHLGLPPLASDLRMVVVARAWAAHMVSDGVISHNPDLASHMPEDWRKYGENVGVGDTVTSLHEAFLASPHHYVNVADPMFNAVGVGVVVTDRVWVVFDFLASASAPAAVPANTALPA